MIVRCYWFNPSEDKVDINCSDGRDLVTGDWKELLEWLALPCNYGLVVNVDGVATRVNAMLPEPMKPLGKGGRYRSVLKGELYEFRVFYIQERQLSITHKTYEHVSGNVYRPKEENEVNIYGTSKLLKFIPEDIEQFTDECRKVLDAFKVVSGEYPMKLPSVVGAAQDVLKELDYVKDHDMFDSTIEMLDYLDPLIGTSEWKEIFQIGHWNEDECTDFDITACYPALCSQLIDLRNADIWQSNSYDKSSHWAVFQGILTMNAPVNPFPYINEPAVPFCYPIGTHPAIITTDQLKLIQKWKLGSFRVTHPIWHVRYHSTHKPFAGIMKRLFSLRQSDIPYVPEIAKSLAVGIYGKLGQMTDGGPGDWYNGIYAAQVVTRGAIQVCDFIYSYGLQDKLISVTLDGALVEGALSGVGTEKKFGEWRKNEPASYLISNFNAQMSSNGKKATDSTSYQEAMDYIMQHPNQPHIDIGGHTRHFPELPKIKSDFLKKKYKSVPFEIKGE